MLDECIFQYTDVMLTQRVGCFREGECFECAIMNYGEKSTMTLQRNGIEWVFPLILTVGDLIHGPDNS